MKLVLDHFIPNFILVSSMIYIWHYLLNKKIDFKNKKLYISIIGIIFISLFNYFVINKFLKIMLITIIFMFFYRYLFREKINRCIITPIYYQLLIMVSETLYLLFITIIGNLNVEKLLTSYLGTFMTNVSIAMISILLVHFKFVRKIYNKIISLIDKVKQINIILFSLFSIISLSIFPITIYYEVDIKYLLIFYSSMIIMCLIIVFYSLKTQSNYNKVYDKYSVAANTLKEYETMMTKYRISNHENKNLLLTIRAMILNKEKDIHKYIDSIVEKKYEDNEKLLFQMNVIPMGGLRATIYTEILKINEKNINYSLNIDKNLSAIDLIELDESSIIDICKIISVLIDNSIEAVSKLRKKNIEIDLFLEDDNINIKVTNNYKGNIVIDKIYEEGYSTKGENRGYGLSLVKRIIDKSDIFEIYTSLSKTTISQTLIIKYKKNKRN